MPASRILSLIIALMSIGAAGDPVAGRPAAAGQSCSQPGNIIIVVHGATLCVSVDVSARPLSEQLLKDWIARSARIVADLRWFPGALGRAAHPRRAGRRRPRRPHHQ